MIPFVDLCPAHDEICISIDKAIDRVRERGIFLNGPEVEAFEEEWAAYCGQRYCVACASGTDAIRIVTQDLGQVVIPANSCPFTEIGLETDYIIRDVDDEGRILLEDEDSETDDRFVMDVLLYGRFPKNTNHCTIFDACQAHGWKPNALLDDCCWSFYPTKNLGCFGDGGAITFGYSDTERIFRKSAQSMHSRMSEINAAVLRIKLPHLNRWNAERTAIAEVYYNELPDWAEPACRPGEPTNHHIFAVLVERRDELEGHLLKNGCGVKVHYREPLADLPGARRWCDRTLSLPIWPGLTAMQVREVCDTMRSFR